MPYIPHLPGVLRPPMPPIGPAATPLPGVLVAEINLRGKYVETLNIARDEEPRVYPVYPATA